MNSEIVESFSQMVREKGIDKDMLAGIVEDVFSMMVRKKYGQDAKFDVVVNMDKGDIEIFLEREVVETVENPTTQIDARARPRDVGRGARASATITSRSSRSQTFGRRLVVSAKQNLNQRIKEIEREIIYNEYSNTVGDIVVGEIYQIRRNEILINHNRNELILPKSEQIFKERYKKGDTIRAVVKEVRKNAGNPVVIVSRADPKFLSKLFEMEIPEIYDGIIEIKQHRPGAGRAGEGRRRVARRPHRRGRRVRRHEGCPDPHDRARIEQREYRRHQFHGPAERVHPALARAGEAQEHRAEQRDRRRQRARGRPTRCRWPSAGTARTSGSRQN